MFHFSLPEDPANDIVNPKTLIWFSSYVAKPYQQTIFMVKQVICIPVWNALSQAFWNECDWYYSNPNLYVYYGVINIIFISQSIDCDT